MWNHRYFLYLDWRLILVVLSLMAISLLVIATTDPAISFKAVEQGFLSPRVFSQIKHFLLGWVVFFFFAGIDYRKLREWVLFLYLGTILSLIGLFFTEAIQNVHRWYKLPLLKVSVQPSEYAKLIVVITLSWFLERNQAKASEKAAIIGGGTIFIIPFFLILKQPDLGTALVLFPVMLIMFYLGNMHRGFLRLGTILGVGVLIFILLIFSGVLSHQKLRPHMTKVLKEYQYERLDPQSPHQQAALTAIGVGGITGSGWRASEFTGRGWLPYGHTDSVFPAFGEEFGFIGLVFLLFLLYALIYLGFQVVLVAQDYFGRMLACGVSVYIAMHILVNIGMMCSFLPITGVPLLLVSYGGSSIFVTMTALGLLQSIYSRRFMF